MHWATDLWEPVNCIVRIGCVCWICPTLTQAPTRKTKAMIAALRMACVIVNFLPAAQASMHGIMRRHAKTEQSHAKVEGVASVDNEIKVVKGS